jgi:DNA-binding transcriptional LysR family regulator
MERLSWDNLRVLLAVHRTGSLLAAGKSLGLSTSTTGRRLDALEAAVGSRLVIRSQAGTDLEPVAGRLVRLAEDLEHGLDAERRDRGSDGGTIKVSVPDGLVHAVAQALLTFRLEHPDTNIELWGENRVVDIAKRQADIGLRLTHSSSSVLVEKQVSTLRFGLYASADYVRRYLPSRRLEKEEVRRHPFIGLDSAWKFLPQEQWMSSLGAIRFPFRSTSVVAIIEAVRQGAGIAALVEQDVRNAGFVRVEVSSSGPTQPLFLVYHHELRKTPHIRAAVAAIETYIRANG